MGRSKYRKYRNQDKGNNVCFSFRKEGTCAYGDECKFKHVREDIISENLVSEALGVSGSYFPQEHGGEEIFRPRPPEERYFEQLFVTTDKNKDDDYEDVFVHMHSNGICAIGLAPGHGALNKKKRKVTKIDFIVNEKNIADFKVSGKRKKGGIWFVASHPLCTIECDDGSKYLVKASIRCKLYEVNLTLLDCPENIYTSSGHLVVVAPKKEEISEMRTNLVGKSEYEKLRLDL
uniref:C3H1-type domain-containing protein n=1 Tax=Aplanochytrium stocchinoi TaxID=215587 RepID=A0A7S3LR36_9STRA